MLQENCVHHIIIKNQIKQKILWTLGSQRCADDRQSEVGMGSAFRGKAGVLSNATGAAERSMCNGDTHRTYTADASPVDRRRL